MPRSARTLLAATTTVLALVGCGGSGGSTTASSPSTTTGGGAVAAKPARSVAALVPPANAPAHNVRVPVLTYHRVAPLRAGASALNTDLTVDPANFVAELAALHDAGYHPISQAQLFDALYRGATLPAKPIIISVDDGYVDDVRTILPALQRWHWVATFFVITGRFTEPGFLTADQIRQLDQAGMDIGDHTAHHVDLRLLGPAELTSETAGSRRVLQRTLGHFVYAFAYPFGAHNDAVVSAVRSAGYTLAYTTVGGVTESTAAPLAMPRLHVGRGETPSGLVALLGGA
jgi:peptidoglycan/xylan/chitin deacetylase (PgdA/CDA1 family)